MVLTPVRCTTRRSPALVIFCWLALACSSPLDPAGPLPVTPLVQRGTSASPDFAQQNLVVRDAQTWETTWAALYKGVSPRPALPGVDFARDLVVVVSMGGKPTAGYSVAVSTADEASGAITVGITQTAPGSSCVLPQIVTNPVAVARIPFHSASERVTFKTTSVVHPCS